MSWGKGAGDTMWVGGEGGLSEQLELEEAELSSYPLTPHRRDLVQGHTSRRPSPPPPRPSACLPRTQAGSPCPAPRPSSRESRKPGGERPGPGGGAAAVQADQGPWRFSQ